MDVGIIGTGNVGTAFCKVFHEAGYKIKAIVSRNIDSAKNCMKISGCENWSNNVDIVKDCELVLICVPDRSIKKIAKKLKKFITEKTIVAHTSGFYPANILKFNKSITLHPIASIKGNSLPIPCFIGIDGDIEIAKNIVKSIGCIPIIIKSEDRIKYHTALNFSAPFLISLLNISCQLLYGIVDEPEKIVISLANSAISNVNKFGIKNALTGPASRNDLIVVKNELKLLKKEYPKYYKLYKLLTDEIFSRY